MGATHFDHHNPEQGHLFARCGAPLSEENLLRAEDSPAWRNLFFAPCADEGIPVIGEEESVAINRFDADTFVGLLRIYGRTLPSGRDGGARVPRPPGKKSGSIG